jgi:hypothetical protein
MRTAEATTDSPSAMLAMTNGSFMARIPDRVTATRRGGSPSITIFRRTTDYLTHHIIDFQKCVWQRPFPDFPPLFMPSGA